MQKHQSTSKEEALWLWQEKSVIFVHQNTQSNCEVSASE